jgi:hypothetical protein
MKKIYAGFFGIIAVVVIVATSAYALFSDKVTMTGMVLGTATPNLEMSVNGTDNWMSTFDVGNLFEPLVPGETDWGEIYFRNSSNGKADVVDMNLTARLTSAGGDWGTLKDAIQMRVCIYTTGTVGHHCDESAGMATGWGTLAYWNANTVTLPGTLIQGTQQHYVMEYFIPSTYGNEIAGKKITGMAFEVVGTQAP